MQKIILLCVGSIKTGWIADGCAQYTDRLKGDLDLEIIEIPASKERDPKRQAAEESDRLIEALEKRDGEVWVLDEHGKQMTSEEFSGVLMQARDQGQSLIFVIGGAYGLSSKIKDCADHILSLGKMTIPHELCRTAFLEQLYRAVQIGKGSGYHH